MDMWWEIPDLNVARHYHSSCTFAEQYVYVFCGINNSTKKYLNSIERFDHKNPGKWELIDPGMILPVRQGCGTTYTGNNQIIIFGGYSARMLKDAYFFDVETHKVKPIPKQPVIEIFSYQMPTLYDSASKKVYSADWSKKKLYHIIPGETDWRLAQELTVFL
jgi:N-acetylneuraminic acid mutarotase